MAALLEQERTVIKATNQQILPTIPVVILAMEKRLLVDDTKIDGMILSFNITSQEDPRASSFQFYA
jgi:glutamate-5-semialdehyde dehydrogenase